MDVNEELTDQAQSLLENTTALIALGIGALLFALVWCRIFAKAGFRSAMGLMMLVPGVNVILLFVLAFGRWPVQHELKAFRRMQKAVHKADAQGDRYSRAA